MDKIDLMESNAGSTLVKGNQVQLLSGLKVGKANFLLNEPSQAPSRLTFRFSDKTTRQLQLKGIDNTIDAPILKSRVNHINKN